MIPLAFRRMVEQVIRGRLGFPQFVAPNTISHAGDLTTSGTTELTLITQTLAAPPVAGQIHVSAFATFVTGTVAGDNFQVRLYIAGSIVSKALHYIYNASGADFRTTSLSATAAIAASTGQIIKLTVVRNGGTGTVTSQGGYNGLSWLILPGAGVTA